MLVREREAWAMYVVWTLKSCSSGTHGRLGAKRCLSDLIGWMVGERHCCRKVSCREGGGRGDASSTLVTERRHACSDDNLNSHHEEAPILDELHFLGHLCSAQSPCPKPKEVTRPPPRRRRSDGGTGSAFLTIPCCNSG